MWINEPTAKERPNAVKRYAAEQTRTRRNIRKPPIVRIPLDSENMNEEKKYIFLNKIIHEWIWKFNISEINLIKK